MLRSATAGNQPLTAYNSISDQYLLEAGIAVPVKKVNGLTLTLGPRFEGVPANDLIGQSTGFRRPGFAISIEPGFQYYHNGHVFTASIGKALYRDRTRSVPDDLLGVYTGDARFRELRLAGRATPSGSIPSTGIRPPLTANFFGACRESGQRFRLSCERGGKQRYKEPKK